MGIPIVAHLGLMPQSVGVMGYKLQGGTKDAENNLFVMHMPFKKQVQWR